MVVKIDKRIEIEITKIRKDISRLNKLMVLAIEQQERKLENRKKQMEDINVLLPQLIEIRSLIKSNMEEKYGKSR